MPAKAIREQLGVTEGLTRDHFGNTALRRLITIQEVAAGRIDRGMEPMEAIARVLSELSFPIAPFNR